MKKLGTFLAVLAVGAVPVMAAIGDGAGFLGGAADINHANSFTSGGGGEFSIAEETVGGFNFSLAAYATETKGTLAAGNAYFQSFCIERFESLESNMRTFVSTANIDGSTPGSHAWKGGTLSGDDLDTQTAYYYTLFAKGTLTGYNYGSGGSYGLNQTQTAYALQRLLWNIEGEGGGLNSGDLLNGVALSADQAQLIADWQTLYAGSGWTGIGTVRILQTFDGVNDLDLQQDLLVLLVPSPAAALLALVGLGGAFSLRRRIA